MTPRQLLAAVLAFLVTVGGLTLAVTTSDDGHGHKSHSLSLHFDRSGQPGTQPATVAVPQAVVQKVGVPGDAAEPLASPSPVIKATVPQQLKAADEAAAAIKATLPPLSTAGASAEVPGCRTMFIRSYGTRHGVRPVQFWLHYTASANVPGWADVLSIVRYFSNPNNQASAHFVIDREGHCAYIVPIEFKAWTQVAGNAFGINFEIIDRGNEPSYLDSAGYAKLRSVLRILSGRTGIPLVKGAVSGCSPTKYGIVTHWMGGFCSGGHVDLKPFDIDQVIHVLTARQPVPKAVRWAAHRRAIHRAYQHKCRHPYQRQRRPVTCAKLGSDGRKLDRLLKRKT